MRGGPPPGDVVSVERVERADGLTAAVARRTACSHLRSQLVACVPVLLAVATMAAGLALLVLLLGVLIAPTSTAPRAKLAARETRDDCIHGT